MCRIPKAAPLSRIRRVVSRSSILFSSSVLFLWVPAIHRLRPAKTDSLRSVKFRFGYENDSLRSARAVDQSRSKGYKAINLFRTIACRRFSSGRRFFQFFLIFPKIKRAHKRASERASSRLKPTDSWWPLPALKFRACSGIQTGLQDLCAPRLSRMPVGRWSP